MESRYKPARDIVCTPIGSDLDAIQHYYAKESVSFVNLELIAQ